MKFNHPIVGLVFVLIIATGVLFWFHGGILTNANHINLGDEHDGLKNYYTPIYHVKYDATFSWFNGMNYPYGEQSVFTDNQPSLSGFLQFFNHSIYNISDQVIGIMNVFMLVSIVLSACFLFLLFKRFKIGLIYAIIYSIGIAFMSPQIMRMGGHYALSYGFVIPLCWWLLVRFIDKPSKIRSGLIACTILIISGLHFYYFAILGGFVILTHLFLAFPLTKKSFGRTVKNVFLQVIIPFIFIKIWFILTDPISDRPVNPYGFLVYRAYWESIFLPIGYPMGGWINQFVKIRNVPWEGISYVGINGILFLFVSFYLFIKHKFSKQKIISQASDKVLKASLLSAVVLLLFSMGFPFILKMEFLLDYLGSLKQFRGIARFSWAFFFVFNVFIFVQIQHKLPKTWLYKIAMSLSVLLLLYEGYILNTDKFYWGKNLEQPNYLSTPMDADWEANIDFSEYQAIIPIPYFHIGSERINKLAKPALVRDVFKISVLTGLPTTAVMMSRSSFDQTLQQIAIVGEKTEHPKIANFFNKKPFLLWTNTSIELTNTAENLLKKAKLIYSKNKIKAYRISVDSLTSFKQYTLPNKPLFKHNSLFSTDTIINYFFTDFDSLKSENKFMNSSVLETSMEQFTQLYEGNLPNQDTLEYEFSAWVYFKEEPYPMNRFLLEERDQNGKVVSYLTQSFGEIYVKSKENWALIKYTFKPKSISSIITISVKNSNYKGAKKMLVDKVLIRPISTTTYYKTSKGITIKNNDW